MRPINRRASRNGGSPSSLVKDTERERERQRDRETERERERERERARESERERERGREREREGERGRGRERERERERDSARSRWVEPFDRVLLPHVLQMQNATGLVQGRTPREKPHLEASGDVWCSEEAAASQGQEGGHHLEAIKPQRSFSCRAATT